MDSNRPVNWDEEAEVVVVGYGGAGAVTAITAHDAGAKVLIIEKQQSDTPKETRHTPSTRMSGGDWGCPDDAEKAAQYLEGLNRIANETVDAERKEYIKLVADQMVGNTAWMKQIGAEIGGQESLSGTQIPLLQAPTVNPSTFGGVKVARSDFPEVPGSDSWYHYIVKAGDGLRHGASFFNVLSNAIKKRAIPVIWEAPARHLVVEGGAVRGVIAEREGKPFAVKATRGVVLTCGGFEFNDWMKENYLRVNPIHFYGNPGNTGDGINMALEVGAALWHMSCTSFRVTFRVPGLPVAFGTQHHEEKAIFVDRRGSRFTNERFKMHAFGYELCNYDCQAMYFPRVPSFWIFDEKRRLSAPVASYHGVCNPPGGVMGKIHYVWSNDNQAEVDKGWIMKARTIEELAAQIASDPDNNGVMSADNLRGTVKRYNQFCRDGEDADFHRPQWTLGALEDPPYYAVKLWPGGPNTQGGPRRDKYCRVLRPDKSPVPRLYACGELGSFWGMLYQGGGNLAENIALGRVAGTRIAEEKRW